jgi:hypothetical protein
VSKKAAKNERREARRHGKKKAGIAQPGKKMGYWTEPMFA